MSAEQDRAQKAPKGPEIKPKRLPSLAAFRESLTVKGRPLSEEIIAAREDEAR